jgi:hypothetical protein
VDWEETALEDLQELTDEERNGMGCWQDNGTGGIELVDEADIYRHTATKTPAKAIKRRALEDAIADLLEKQ